MYDRKIVRVYKRLIPKILRDKITILRNSGGLNTIRRNILSYYSSPVGANSDEIKQVLGYLKKKPLRLFPYRFPDKYDASDIKVYHDDQLNLNYVLHQEKRMYFKRSWAINDIRENYTNLLIEQDEDSPHRYLNEKFNINPGFVVADVGAAEGIFSLSIINDVKKIYLFETDTEWIEALRATFCPWIDKIEIVNRFVSDKNTADAISLDEFEKREHVSFDFIKVDIDGAEDMLLKGCHEIFSETRKIKLAVCTYHNAGDELLFSNILKNYNFSVSPSLGYMVFYYDLALSAPYLRRGLLRAIK